MTEPRMTESRQQRELTRDEALRLLSTVPLGRVVFTHRALPAIRPVNHVVDGHRIIFRTGSSAAITTAVDGTGTIVAFEADAIDSVRRTGWSVVVIGGARLLTDAVEVGRYLRVLQPWAAGTKDDIIVIRADMVTGVRVGADDGGGSRGPAS
jgi:nitroimidazol reductase NimA-like FMN-containing flavoprotein (pyridoxamine 5'-phosphate oxidase superfamily)